MHYYQHHIGDFIRDTSRLPDSHLAAYLRMLWMYYESEQPLTNNALSIGFRIGAPADVVELIFESFFKRDGETWRHTRCDAEIAAYHAICERNKTNGKAGGRPKKTQSVPTGNRDVTDTEPNSNPNHEPLNQEPIHKEAKASMSGSTFPPCPQQDILKLWAKHLPHLAQPRIWEGNRQAMLRQRWVQAGKPSNFSPGGYKTVLDGLQWWDEFFGYIASETKLSNGFETQGRTWTPDLEWIVTAGNFQKIIDGKYDK